MTAIALVAGWTTTGCGVRLADAPPPLPTPDANEAGRAEAVESALAIADLAGAVLATAQYPELQVILEQVEHGSAIQSEALGGLWVPPPRPTPTDATQSPSAGPTGTVDVAQLVTALSDAAAAARTAAVDADATVGRLLVSIAAWRDLAAHVVADAAGTDVAGEDPLAPPALGSGGIYDAALQVSTLGPSSELLRGARRRGVRVRDPGRSDAGRGRPSDLGRAIGRAAPRRGDRGRRQRGRRHVVRPA